MRGMAKETLAVIRSGRLDGADITADIERAVRGTRLILPGDELPAARSVAKRPAAEPPVVEVTGESTLAAAARLGDPVCLNFASARNPGGGFLNGAQAQEESLARSSALYPCLLEAGEFYAHHRAERSLLYTDRVIYAPRVPVFRDDRGRLLPTAYPVSFLTAAAPNRSMIVRNQPELLPQVPGELARRAARVLRVAAAFGHTEIVLGAWGCGVFGNDPGEVADAFAEALRETPFARVVFAILDRREEMRDAFRARFPACAR
ncbi:TIGR02452 family protein [Actinoplanes sp. OR16]|nr:TIGR02452 family protein [Actinoplanes sp. OR16]